jgi:hypothetical protein
MSTLVYVSLLLILLSLVIAMLFFYLCLEITQQSLKCLLIVIMLFPESKIANVSGVANESGPASFDLHYYVI